MKKVPFNPYIVGNPVKTKEMFFGRQDEFQYVIRKVGESRANQIIVLCGDRRSGKTSILFQILSGRLGEEFIPVLIDMQILAGIRSDFELYKAILGTACTTFKHPGINLEKIITGDENNIAEMFENFLKLVQVHYPGKVLLLLLDEYELIEAKIRDGTLSDVFIHHLAGILESPYKISFVFTGSTNLEKRKTEYWKSLLGKSIYRKISYLSFNDTARLITEPLKDYIAYTPELVESIYRLSGGQPFYTQVICQNMVDFLADEAKDTPEPADLIKITRDIVDNPLPQMIYSWKSLTDINKLVLSALAGIIDNDNGWADARGIYAFFRKSRIHLPVSVEQVKISLEENYHNEFLEKNDEDSYRFKIDLLRKWIKKEHSIWKVVKETGAALKKKWNPFVLAATAIGFAAILLLVFLFAGRLFFPAAGSPEPGKQTAAAEVANFQFISNHAPFAVIIDDNPRITSEGQADPYRIIIPALKAGEHRCLFISSRTGENLEERILADDTHSFFKVTFREPEQTTASEAQRTSVRRAVSGGGSRPRAGSVVKYGSLFMLTEPPGADILLDGRKLDAKTPFLIEELQPGTHTLEIELTGYRTETFTEEAEADVMGKKEIRLEPVYGYLYLNILPAGQIYIDGKYFADAPYLKSIKLQAGEHTIRIVNENLGAEKQESISLGENQELKRDFDLRKGD